MIGCGERWKICTEVGYDILKVYKLNFVVYRGRSAYDFEFDNVFTDEIDN